MKVKLKIEKEFDARFLDVSAEVRYWEDAEVDDVDDEEGNLIPCREGDYWRPYIDIDRGQILGWKEGVAAKIHYKVCDMCSFKVLDDNSNTIYEQINDYVPNVLSPKDSGYGDYIIMDVDAMGYIKDWNKNDLLEELKR